MSKLALSISTLALAFLLTNQSRAQTPAPKQKTPIALVGGTVHTLRGMDVPNATLVFVDGKITDLFQQQKALPKGTRTIDIKGKHVYPGMIAANTVLGLVEINAVRATVDYAEVGQIKPEVHAEVAVNPDSRLLPVTRSNGVLCALTIPSGGLVAGRSAVIQLDGWTYEDLTASAPLAMHVRWPRFGGGGRGFFGPPAPPSAHWTDPNFQL